MHGWEHINTDYLYVMSHKFFNLLLQYKLVLKQETLSTEMNQDRQVQASVDLVILNRACRLRDV
jgi:hypothetical protein